MEFSSETSSFALLAAGFVIGLYHSLDADHLAAISTIVSDRKSFWNSSFVGAMWGVGHTSALLAVGAMVVWLKIGISARVESYLEAAVGLMLVILGANVIRKLFKAEKIHFHEHTHGGLTHVHLHLHLHKHEAAESNHHGFALRSAIVGMIHGLAGSAGLMLLILPTIGSGPLSLVFVLIFGIGSIAGMMVMSLLLRLPLHLTVSRFENLNKGVRTAAGLFSIFWGIFLIGERIFPA